MNINFYRFATLIFWTSLYACQTWSVGFGDIWCNKSIGPASQFTMHQSTYTIDVTTITNVAANGDIIDRKSIKHPTYYYALPTYAFSGSEIEMEQLSRPFADGVPLRVKSSFDMLRPDPLNRVYVRKTKDKNGNLIEKASLKDKWVRPHTGVDLSCLNSHGTPQSHIPIFPIADGIVIFRDDNTSSAGNCVVIKHPFMIDMAPLPSPVTGYIWSSYYHMQFPSTVSVGQPVKSTDTIGYCGQTGAPGLPVHLHLNIYSNWDTNNNMLSAYNIFTDPKPFIFHHTSQDLCDEYNSGGGGGGGGGIGGGGFNMIQEALLPHDPNHMSGPEGMVTPGQTMTYAVEFENEGDGTAFGTYVTDVLDGNLDDSMLSVRDFYSVDWATNAQTPATFQYSYDSHTRTLTVFTGDDGPRKGGKFIVEARLKSDTPVGAVTSNNATVYFPSNLEETRNTKCAHSSARPMKNWREEYL